MPVSKTFYNKCFSKGSYEFSKPPWLRGLGCEILWKNHYSANHRPQVPLIQNGKKKSLLHGQLRGPKAPVSLKRAWQRGKTCGSWCFCYSYDLGSPVWVGWEKVLVLMTQLYHPTPLILISVWSVCVCLWEHGGLSGDRFLCSGSFPSETPSEHIDKCLEQWWFIILTVQHNHLMSF